MPLIVDEIRTRIGVSPVHRGLSVRLASGEIVAVLGSNGAGKTSLLRAIMGLLPLASGRISLGSRDISREPPHVRNRLGLAYVPEGRRVFAPMSVRENLELGAYGRSASPASLRDEVESMFERFPVLREKAGNPAGTLSGGQQQMLAIGRALMSRPSFLLLDEPSLGLAPKIVSAVADVIRDLGRNVGTAILLVEQNAGLALSVADRLYLMARGTVVDDGPPARLARSETLRALYLGEAEPERPEPARPA